MTNRATAVAISTHFCAPQTAVEELLAPSAYQRFRDATARLVNRAVFEIPDILERIAKAGR